MLNFNVAENDSCCSRTFCTGGINESDPWNPKDNKEHAVMVFFRDYVARLLNIPAIKGNQALVLVVEVRRFVVDKF